MLKKNISVQEETYKAKLAARRERMRLKRSGMSGGSNDNSFFGAYQHPMTSRNLIKPRPLQNEEAKRAPLNNSPPKKQSGIYGPATSKAGYSASFVPGRSGFLFTAEMIDDEDINDISGIANDLSNVENTLEISLFKNNRSNEPKVAPKYEDDNFFDGYDNSLYTVDDQDQEEYNNS